MRRARTALLSLTLAALLGAWAMDTATAGKKRGRSEDEVYYDDAAFKKLDTFEANRLSEADRLFNDGKYKAAYASYKGFVLEFGKSPAVAYALMRQGRCLQHLKKRSHAIRDYTEVLDYFPNDVKYAAAALYYIGECHWQNGDDDKALAAWARLAKDKGYSRVPLAAKALNQLARGLIKKERYEEAIRYAESVAVNFRKANPKASEEARGMVIEHYMRRDPDREKLRAFYEAVGGFDGRPTQPGKDVDTDRAYWDKVRHYVREHGRFSDKEKDLRNRYYQYWASSMEGKFPAWDDYHKNVADYHLAHEGDRTKWFQRLDAQFARNQKPGDFKRVIQWIRYYEDHKGKVDEYYKKIDFSKMTNAEIESLLKVAFADVRNEDLGRGVFGRLDLNKMKDGEKADLARWLGRYSPELSGRLTRSMKDKEEGTFVMLGIYHSAKDAENGVPLADELKTSERFADKALWMKGELLMYARKYQEAIPVFQQCDNPPDNSWKIAECYAKAGKVKQAVVTLQEIEGFFKEHAPEAALRIAYVYKNAKMKPQYVATLRAVLAKYPKSKQSSAAHNELEKMGLKIGGGVDAE